MRGIGEPWKEREKAAEREELDAEFRELVAEEKEYIFKEKSGMERNVLVVGAGWVGKNFWGVVVGVVLAAALGGFGWLVTDYRKVREQALHGEQLFQWVQQQNAQKQVQPVGTPVPGGEKK